MTSTATLPTGRDLEADDLEAAELDERALLAELGVHRQVITAAEIEELDLVHAWARAHPALGDASVLTPDEAPGGDGTPSVAAFTAEPLALALAISPTAAQALIADVLDLHHRLPRLLDQIRLFRLPVWRARRIAKATRALPFDAARWVDRQLLGTAGSVGPAQLDRLIATAIARVNPEGKADREATAQAHWDVTLTHPRGWAGTSTLTATGDTADLTGLMEIVAAEAESLDALDPAPAGARRVKALSSLIRRGDRGAQDALDFTTAPDGPDSPDGPRTDRRRRDRVRLYLHASLSEILAAAGTADSIAAADGELDAIGTVERLGPLTLTRIKKWLGHSRVTVIPVLDLADDPWTPQHDPPPRTAERVVLRDGGCVFPGCGRDARSADLDHIVPWPHGSTRPSNLAPLCRRHHRLKTAGVWSYDRIDGDYLWTGPQGQLVHVHRGVPMSLDALVQDPSVGALKPSDAKPSPRSVMVASNSRSRSTP